MAFEKTQLGVDPAATLFDRLKVTVRPDIFCSWRFESVTLIRLSPSYFIDVESCSGRLRIVCGAMLCSISLTWSILKFLTTEMT